MLPPFKPILYCFQGGGTGAIESHIGELTALERFLAFHGLKAINPKLNSDIKDYPVQYTGTSAGAITASLLAEGWDSVDICNKVTSIPTTNWFKRIRWRTWLVPFGLSEYAFDNTGLFKFLQATLTDKSYHKASVAVTRYSDYTPLMVNATPMNVLASTTIPFAFKPVDIQGIKYVDGGILNNIPLPTFTSANDFSHIFVFLCTQSITGQYNNTLGRFLDLIVKVMEREVHQVLEYGWGDLPNVTIFNPPPFKHTPILKWSPEHVLIRHAYEYALELLETKKSENHKKYPDRIVEFQPFFS